MRVGNAEQKQKRDPEKIITCHRNKVVGVEKYAFIDPKAKCSLSESTPPGPKQLASSRKTERRPARTTIASALEA